MGNGADQRDPLIGPEVDLRDFDFMPLYGKRLFASETWIMCDPEEKVAALRLWWASWHEEPAGSLPNNDRMLADLAGYGVAIKAFQAVKANAILGWVECSDGRLYHPVVCQIADDSWQTKKRKREENERDRARKATKKTKVPAESSGSTTNIPPETMSHSGGKTKKAGHVSSGIPSENALKGREEDKTLAKANDADGVLLSGSTPSPPSIPAANPGVWGKPLDYLISKSGRPMKDCRTMLGKWRKDNSDDAIVAAITRAQVEDVIEPISFLIALLAGKAKAEQVSERRNQLGFGDI